MERSRRNANGDSYVDVPVRVRYADTDRMGVVYYGTYPVYFEVGRSEFMREKGFTYKTFEETGFSLIVISMEAKYHTSAHYDDLLMVRTRIRDLRSRGLTFHYEILRDNTLIVEGNTRHICLNSHKKPTFIPPSLFDILRDAAA
jgi:acyl-CoA thioester hydrolase